MNVKIGNRSLKEITPEELLEIVIIEGCVPILEYWNKPDITDFNNKLFGNTVVIDYIAFRKEDNLKSRKFTFFFNFEDFCFHYTTDYDKGNNNYQSNGRRAGLETLRFLIKQGFNVPLY